MVNTRYTNRMSPQQSAFMHFLYTEKSITEKDFKKFS